MSSCQKSIITEDEAKDARIGDIKKATKQFLNEVIFNLCLPEGPSGRLDMAFNINRAKVILEVLKELSEELEISLED